MSSARPSSILGPSPNLEVIQERAVHLAEGDLLEDVLVWVGKWAKTASQVMVSRTRTVAKGPVEEPAVQRPEGRFVELDHELHESLDDVLLSL
jgi:hypothetical protein